MPSGLVLGAVIPSAQDIANAIVNFLGAAILNSLKNATVQAVTTPFQPVVKLMLTTDPATTYANQAVISTWTVMAAVANVLLALMVISGGFQMMIGRATGTVYVPPREFLPKFLAGAIAVNVSLLFGQVLIDINNAVCSLAQFDMAAFVQSFGQGTNQNVIIIFTLSMIFDAVFLFLIFQVVGRIALLNLLLVLSPIWMLMWLLPQTQPYAEFGSRTLVITTFTQAIQVIAFTVGAKFLTSAGFHDPITMLLLGTGIMFTIGSIPRLLSRLGIVGGSSAGNLGGLISTAARAAAMLAA